MPHWRIPHSLFFARSDVLLNSGSSVKTMFDSSTAKWIEPVELDSTLAVQRPAYLLATSFRVDQAVQSATLRLTAHGLVEAFINGVRISEDELLPGFTAYRKRLEVHTFDVTAQVTLGANGLGVLLSDGWWRGQNSSARRTNSYGPTTAVLAELEIQLASGAKLTVVTGDTWRSKPSHILGADVIAGEVHDLRQRSTDWATGHDNRADWNPVRLADHDNTRLSPPLGPPCRRIQELRPMSIREIALQRHVIDFGQNINGWVRLTDLGPIDTRLTLVYGEALDASGDVIQSNVSHADRFPDRPFQTDIVISAGDGSTFEPRHSTKGFRYVRLEGHAGALGTEAVTAVVVHSALDRAGDFACSDERLNRLHAAIDWSFRGNACAVPTDCPTRERAGWSGDYQTFIETAAYLYDVTGFSRRWLCDMAAEQWADGTILNYVPDPHDFALGENAAWRHAQGAAGWGDASCHVPWSLYQSTGQVDILAPLIQMMRGWVDFALGRAAGGRHPTRATARPDPLPHERYLWDTGFHFGEWTEPDSPKDPAAVFARIMTMDHGPTATAFLYRSASELARMTAVMGDMGAGTEYARIAALVREAWCTEFVDTEGRVQPHTQANLVRALAFDLLPVQHRQRAADDLVALVRLADNHLGTGFLATPFLLPVLADHGHLNVAYDLLFQNTPPSWLHMVDKNATTMWENWDGLDNKGEGSLNHYSKGSVASFLHRYVAGLQIVEPGYRRFRVAPRPGAGITAAGTWHASPFGRISVAWRVEGDHATVEITVPAGTQADVELPDGTQEQLSEGSHVRHWRSAI